MKKIIYFVLNALLALLSIEILHDGVTCIVNQNLYKEAGITVGYDFGIAQGIVRIVLFAVIIVLLTLSTILYFLSESKSKPIAASSVLTVIATFFVLFYIGASIYSILYNAYTIKGFVNTMSEEQQLFYSLTLNFRGAIVTAIFDFVEFAITASLMVIYLVSKREE